MERALQSPDQTDDEAVRWFNSNMETLEQMDQFDEVYSRQSSKIWTEIGNFTAHGSGWIIKNVEGITIDISSYRPFYHVGCEQNIPVPTQIRNSKATINVRNTQDRCFQYSTICSAYYHKVKKSGKKTTEVSSYKKYFNRFNFQGMKFPLEWKEKNFKKFEAMNPKFALNILCLKTYQKNPEKRDGSSKPKPRRSFPIHCYRTSPHARNVKRKNLFILCLYNPSEKKSHFVAVTKLNTLLSQGSASKPNRRATFCWPCKRKFTGLNYKRNYQKHKKFCKNNLYCSSLIRTKKYRNMAADDDGEMSICTNCFTEYDGADKIIRGKALLDHQKYCLENKPTIIKFPEEDYVYFKNFNRKKYVPFTIYADTESLMANNEIKNEMETMRRDHREKRKKQRLEEEEEENKWMEVDSDSEETEDEDVKMEEEYNDSDDDDLHLEMFDSHDESVNEERDPKYNVVYDDTERSSEPDDGKVLNTHEMSSFSFKVKTIPSLQSYFPSPITYCGKDAQLKFFEYLHELKNKIRKVWEKEGDKKMTPLSREEQKVYDNASHCHICEQKFDDEDTRSFKEYKNQFDLLSSSEKIKFEDKGPKIRDHDHFTSKFIAGLYS